MKTIVLLLFLTNFIFSQPIQIKSFGELISNLRLGEEIRIVIHYKDCKLLKDSIYLNPTDVIGGMTISAFEFFEKGSIKNERAYLAFSENVFIYHKRYGYVYNYVKIRIYDDDEVEIIAQYLKPENFEVVMNEIFYCKINNNNNGGVFLFRNK